MTESPSVGTRKRLGARFVMALTVAAVVANLVSVALIAGTGRPLRTAPDDSVIGLAAERASLIERFGFLYDLERSGAKRVRAPEGVFVGDELDGLVDIELVEGPGSGEAGSASGTALRGVYVTADRTFEYVIRPTSEPDRQTEIIEDTLVVTPDVGE